MSASSKKKLRKEQEAAKLTERQQREQKEAKKLKGYTIGFIAAIVAIVLTALLTIGITTFVKSGFLERHTDTVKIGSHTLTADQFNYYFIDEFQNTYRQWQSEYGSSADMLIAWGERFDITKPLKDQKHPTVAGKTYADYFAEVALEKAKETYALYDAAVAAGFSLTDEEITNINDTVRSMETLGMLYGYASLKDYIKYAYGNGATEESFREYLTVTTLADSYKNHHMDELSYEKSEIDAYNNEHFNDFSSFDYSSFVLMPDDFLEHDESGAHNHSEEDSAKGLIKAEEAANNIAATVSESESKTIKEFNAAIQQIAHYKEKTAAEKDGELFTVIPPAIAEWLASEDRQVGEVGVVPYTSTSVDAEGNEIEKTVGYYVVLFEGRDDNETKLVTVRHMMVEFKGGNKDADGNTVYSEEEKAAAKEKAEKLLAAYEGGGKNEDAFKGVVNEDEGTGNYDDAEFFEDMYPGQKVKSDEFNDWCFSADRKAGDCEMVETEFGWHVIFFVSRSEDTYRTHMIEHELAEAEHEEWYKNLVESTEASIIDISKLSIDMTVA